MSHTIATFKSKALYVNVHNVVELLDTKLDKWSVEGSGLVTDTQEERRAKDCSVSSALILCQLVSTQEG